MMVSPKKIHEWIVRALEEPFYRAEMRRVEVLLPDAGETKLRLIEGSGKKGSKRPVDAEEVRRLTARTQ